MVVDTNHQQFHDALSLAPHDTTAVTGNARAKRDEGNGVDAVLEVDEAAEVGGHVPDEGSAKADGADRSHERQVTAVPT